MADSLFLAAPRLVVQTKFALENLDHQKIECSWNSARPLCALSEPGGK
jgi:hypothetical protein